jgi:hypothetical protein
VIYGQVCVCGHNLNKPRGADGASADRQRPATNENNQEKS